MVKKHHLRLNWRILNAAVVFSLLFSTIQPAWSANGEIEPAINSGEIVITEIMADPQVVSDTVGEWLEFYNATDREIDLSACFFGDASSTPHQLDGLVMGAFSYVVMARNTESSQNGGVTDGINYGGFVLNNSADSVVLKCGETIVDQVEYDFSAGWSGAAGASIVLADPALDNDNPANWCLSSSEFGAGDLGTPGFINDRCGSEAPQEPICTDNDLDGYSQEGGACGPSDCADSDALINPDGLEVCNEVDDNCNGEIDEGDVCLVGPTCGNGAREESEQCDDSNTVTGDGCSNLCQLEPDIPCGQLAETTGWYGRYFNYSREHPEMDIPPEQWPSQISGHPLGIWTTDWYDAQYFSFARIDNTIAFGDDFFPFDSAVTEFDNGHEFYFGVHWRGLVEITTAGDYGYYLDSDDDSWLYLDGALVTDLSGISSKELVSDTVYLSAGRHIIDIYFANRQSLQSSFQFYWQSPEIIVKPVAPDCPLYPYCGDGQINQAWEQCDGGADCTEHCLLPDQTGCQDLVLAKIDITNFANWGNGNMTDDVYLGGIFNAVPSGTWFPLYWQGQYFTDTDIGAYEAVPGLAVERTAGHLRLVMGASHQLDDLSEEHSQGRLEFYNARLLALVSDEAASAGGPNGLEEGFDGIGIGSYDSENDEVWSESSSTVNFWLTADVADDGFYADWEIITDCRDAKLSGYKWFDRDRDGQWGETEVGLADWLIKLIKFNSCDPGEPWADAIVAYQPGLKDTGAPLDQENLDPSRALGEAQFDDSLNFVSLGLGGSLVLEFDNIIYNGFGADLEIIETSPKNLNGDNCLETVGVWASPTGATDSWQYLGSGCLSSAFDLGDLNWAKYLKLVDQSDPAALAEGADGFDVDGVRAIHCAAGFESIANTQTDADGSYCFDHLATGHYQVMEDLPGGWINSTPWFYDFDIDNNDSQQADFGNYLVCTDQDEDGYSLEGGACGPSDCADDNSAIHPGAPEVCNQADDNCDGQIDEGGICSTGVAAGGLPGLYIHTETSQSQPTGVRITWFTNRPANSRVVYDTIAHPLLADQPNYGYHWSSPTYNDASKVTYHSVLLENLDPNVFYYFRPISASGDNEAKGVELAAINDLAESMENTSSSLPTALPETDSTATPALSAGPDLAGGSVSDGDWSIGGDNSGASVGTANDELTEAARGEEADTGTVAGAGETCNSWPNWLVMVLVIGYGGLLLLNYFSKSIKEEENDQDKKSNRLKDNLVWPFIIFLAAGPILAAIFCAGWSWWLWLLVVIVYFVILRFYYQGIATKNYWTVSVLLTLFLLLLLAIIRSCRC